MPDGQIVGGVNNYHQKSAEPPSEPAAKGDQNVDTLKDGEEKASDIADAKNAFTKAAKKEADAAAEQ